MTTTAPPLSIALGHASLRGPCERNEDFCGAATPEGAELDAKGMLAALADGLGGHANGREASEYTVRGLLSDYYATSDTWSVARSLDTVIGALNRWLHAHSRKTRETAGMATTLSAIALRGRRYTIAHVGDSRIYRLRDGALDRLTNDHVWGHPELDNVLSRAVGLDERISVNISDGNLEQGDSFILLSDGVWTVLGEARIADILARSASPESAAKKLVEAAIGDGGQDNATALVLRVTQLPHDGLPDVIERLRKRPLPPRLKPGQRLDGLTVTEVLHESLATLLYRVHDEHGHEHVLKTLRPEADAPEFTAALAHEEWLASRVHDARFPRVEARTNASHLYYLMDWHDGVTLAARLESGHRFSPGETTELSLEIMRGLATLHRLSILHRDIKPANLHLGADNRLRILDLGVAASDGQAEHFSEINNPGTPSYMAPELYAGEPASPQSDLYAAGVTLYELLTRRFPYGEIEPFQNPRFGDPVPPTRYRPDIPSWLESVILKAVARNPRNRFETAEEFLLALEAGALRPLVVPRSTPLLQRNSDLRIRLLTVGSIVLNVLLLYLLFAR